MSDPAVEAAQRVLDRYGFLADLPMDRGDLEAAAREALRPVREWYENTNIPWSDILSLIYATEELERWR
jgi:hypothetical protein